MATDAPIPAVSPLDEWAKRSRAARLARLGRTADDLAAALRGVDRATLTRRPDENNWAPIEILCHLRDSEASFLDRFRQIMATDEPRFPTINPNRVAEERRYLEQAVGAALESFHRHRDASIMFFAALGEVDWSRAGHQMDSRGRRTIDDFLGVMAWHDENHLAQLARALRGEA
jgi:DinB superfamily